MCKREVGGNWNDQTFKYFGTCPGVPSEREAFKLTTTGYSYGNVNLKTGCLVQVSRCESDLKFNFSQLQSMDMIVGACCCWFFHNLSTR